MKRLQTTFLAAGLGCAFVVLVAACGDDDTNGAGPRGQLDAGAGSSTSPPDGSTNPDGSTPDSGRGGCEFNAFVLGLIQNSTTATAVPSTDLGEACVDDQTPFPATLFQ